MDIDLKTNCNTSNVEAESTADNTSPIEDDVPPNFFDDFMNEDFIDGLNVVDTWDEEEAKKTASSSSPRQNGLNKEDNKETEKVLKEKYKSTERNYSPRRKRFRSRSPRQNRLLDKKRSNSKESERRDPNKTQRDILRDKDKCAKDQKAKLISEKLKVVETGLVPPGMEMEVELVLPSAQPEKVENKPQKVRKSVERARSPEFDRKYRRSTPDRVRRSPLRRSRFSPPRRLRSRSRTRSPRRREEKRERFLDQRGEKRRRSISRSPRRRRTRSPQSEISDRERWLRRRSRSRGPRRDKKDKDSFLQELKETMNRPSEPPPMGPQHFQPTPVPPPPQNFIPQTLILPPRQEYDQQFFIGQPDLTGSMNYPQAMGFMPQNMGQHMIPHQPMHIPYMMEAPVPQPVPIPDYIPLTPQIQTPTVPLMGKETLSKLFNDKKITLSDYLSLTGKFTDESRPVNIQNKIKVISDCQDIIKELSGEAKISARFVVRKTARVAEKVSEGKHQSPFKKIPLVRFQYTTRSKPGDEKPMMTSLLSKLLTKFGKESMLEETPKASPVESSSTQSPPPTIIYEEEKKGSTYKSAKTSVCQTDQFKCPECETRSSKVFLNMVTQTSDVLTFDVGCQVGPEDFPKSPTKGILKGQSLASMTPAQLLANARGESPKPAYAKHSFDSSPEPKRVNRNDSFNDEDGNQGRFNRSYDFGDFDRYRGESERIRGPLFERDRTSKVIWEKSSETHPTSRPDASSGTPNPGGQGFQSRHAPRWIAPEPRPENEDLRFDGSGRSGFNQPPPKLNANPPGGSFGRGGRRF